MARVEDVFTPLEGAPEGLDLVKVDRDVPAIAIVLTAASGLSDVLRSDPSMQKA
jgi:hypothetical protein